MWTLEIEDVKSNIKTWKFDNYTQADNFIMKYLNSHHVSDHHISRIYATEDHPTVTTGELIEESGELFFDDSTAFHANYTITRR